MAKHCCNTCGAWAVRNGAFCWHCGMALAAPGRHRFEASYGSNGIGAPASAQAWEPGGVKTSISEHVWRVAALGLGAGCGVLFADWPAATIPIAMMTYAMAGPAGEFIATLAGKMPPVEFGGDGVQTLRVEHIERGLDGRKFIGLYDLPQQITLAKLKHVAKICLPMPHGAGRGFSRPALQKSGTFSQHDYAILREFWLQSNHCFWRDVNAPNLGVELSERARRLLKKALLVVVDCDVPGQTMVLATKTGVGER